MSLGDDAMTETIDDPKVEHHGFGAEVGRLLDLVVHSLYSEREIFLRELVANSGWVRLSKRPRRMRRIGGASRA
jgi:hypothetical protein